jgi:hypothetical protein
MRTVRTVLCRMEQASSVLHSSRKVGQTQIHGPVGWSAAAYRPAGRRSSASGLVRPHSPFLARAAGDAKEKNLPKTKPKFAGEWYPKVCGMGSNGGVVALYESTNLG